MVRNVEYFFVQFLAICVSSSGNGLFNSFSIYYLE
jgi:hypothetical protein